jgi:TolB-like protein/class 3 adenylate cyclase
MPEARKLATIMAIDVAGYSHAAEVDDGAAAEAVVRLRAAIDEAIAPHGGRVFSTAGDGFMVEFPAAASGVASAQALLAAVRERALPRVRLGLHLGDVIVEPNGDLLGHGVNVAARLMQMAEPNTAVLSQAVQTQLRQAADVQLKSLGRVQLDKMSERIEVFALAPRGAHFGRVAWRRWRPVLSGALALAALVAVGIVAWQGLHQRGAPATPRLAVLHLETLGDTEPYFAEGLADELIEEASRIPGLDVTARASSFALTGARATPANAARELGATLVLTGSVRRTPDAIRVNAQLAEAPGGRIIWDQSFIRPSADVFALQRDVAIEVARAAGLRLDLTQQAQVDPEAFALYLRGRDSYLRRTNARVSEARDFFRAATLRAPNFAEALAWLSWTDVLVVERETYDTGGGHALSPQMFAEALRHADRAIALNPSLYIAYQTRESVFADLGRWREADEASNAVETRGGRPFRARALMGRARALLPALRRFAELNPLDAGDIGAVSYACLSIADYTCAEQAARRALELSPQDNHAADYLFIVQAVQHDGAGARQTLREHAAALQADFVADPILNRRILESLLSDTPQVPTQELVAAFNSDAAHLDDVIWILAFTGRVREAAALLPQWSAADRQYLNELYEPILAPLRRTPEFWAVMEREGLTAYWRASGHWPDFCDREPVCPR